MKKYSSTNIAVMIPCFNEHETIIKVIKDFKKELPDANIYVFDNNSTDGSYALAKNADAIVIKEKRQGKGFVVSSMLNKVVADIYVMVDGDDTYPSEKVHDLISPVLNEEADMVVGQRMSNYSQNAFRPLHYIGNRLVGAVINAIFSSKLEDPMSGYRVFNRMVVMELPIVATGFDVETEMTLQMLYRHFKLNTFKDGFKVVYKIFSILQSYKPLTFFGGIGLLLSFFGIIIGAFVIREYVLYEYIYSVPKAILASGLGLIGVISATIGIILHTMNFRLLELSSNASRLFHYVDSSLKNKNVASSHKGNSNG
jgi:glycosyltransferase involved in cell wall biosynthesis